MMKHTKVRYLIVTACFLTLLILPSSVSADSVVFAGHTPAIANYLAYCDGNYHGLRYCNFGDTFSVSENRVVSSLTWFDLGCSANDQSNMTLSYVLANAETYAVIAETTQTANVVCNSSYPPGHNKATTLSIPPTMLVAGQKYFVLLRSSRNERARAYWGVDANTGSSFQVNGSLELKNISQFNSDGLTTLPESGTTTANNVVLRGELLADVGDRLQLQAEVRLFGQGFSGTPTASSSFVNFGEVVEVPIVGLPDGAYHWRLRAAYQSGGVSEWQEFGVPGNADFEVFSGPFPDRIVIPNPSCHSASTFVPHTPMVVASANFWTSCFGGLCNGSSYSRILNASGSVVLTESDRLTSGFAYTQNAYDLNYTTSFSGANQIILQPGVMYTFRNFQSDGSDCTAGPYHGSSAFLTVTPPIVPKEPVVLVPGILGSSLSKAIDGTEVWPDVNSMVFSASDRYLDYLKLDARGLQIAGKEMRVEHMIRSASFSLFGHDLATQVFYGDLVKQFTDRGYVLGVNLFEAPYDWRADIRQEVSRLRSVMEIARSTSTNGKVSIVAHSMGGLLVKQFLTVPEQSSYVDRVVLVGVPQLGAPSMFKALNYGDNLGFRFPVINKDLLNFSEVKDIVQNMPGAYELLPTRRYTSLIGGYIRDFRDGAAKILSYDETNTLMTTSQDNSRNQELINSAQTFHDVLDEQPVLATKIYNIVGCGNPATVGEIRLYDKNKIDIAGVDGDGTVPSRSATNLSESYENYYVSSPVTGINHSGLIRDPRTTRLIADLIDGSTISLPSGISDLPEVCSPASSTLSRTLRFSTHSPVALHAYDPEGRHAGPLEDGTIETAIPGSEYLVFGENSFVFVPDGRDYRVVARGLDRGEFTLKSEKLEGIKVVASSNYLNVPVAGTSTTAEALFVAGAPTPTLTVDQNGDGAPETTLEATASLLDSSSTDVTPPSIFTSGIPTSTFVADNPFVVTFSASDDLSGLAILTGTLDGAVFASNTILSVAPGNHTFVFEAVDKAGNPRVLRTSFEALPPTPAIPAYYFEGFLDPSLNDGSGIYKIGSVLPLKFQLLSSNGTIVTNAKASFTLTKISNIISGTHRVRPKKKKKTTSGNEFIYNPKNKQYVFNLATQNFSRGTWELDLDLDDGQSYSVTLSFR